MFQFFLMFIQGGYVPHLCIWSHPPPPPERCSVLAMTRVVAKIRSYRVGTEPKQARILSHLCASAPVRFATERQSDRPSPPPRVSSVQRHQVRSIHFIISSVTLSNFISFVHFVIMQDICYWTGPIIIQNFKLLSTFF